MATNILRQFSIQEIEKELERRKNSKSTGYPANTVILLGPPGVGKATQCHKMKEEFGYCHIASGQLLRYHMSTQTKLGQKARRFFVKGDLVPDYIINEIVKQELNNPECSKGVVFEGYPKNIQQAEFLDNALSSIGKKLDFVFEFTIEEEVLLERIEGRRVHPTSGRSYHLKFNPPKVEGFDDLTGEPLIQRPDDKREIAKIKFEHFYKNLDAVIHFYSSKNIMHTIDAMQPINTVWKNLRDYLI